MNEFTDLRLDQVAPARPVEDAVVPDGLDQSANARIERVAHPPLPSASRPAGVMRSRTPRPSSALRRACCAQGRPWPCSPRTIEPPAASMAGVLIKCQAVQAVARLGMFGTLAGSVCREDKPSWQEIISADILRIASAHA